MPAIDSKTSREYQAAWEGVALIDRSALGRLEVTGADSLDLLHRLSTQDLHRLERDQGDVTILTSEKGRVIDLVAVHHFGDRLVLVTSADNQQAVASWLDKYTIIEDSATRDLTAETGLLAFFGTRADELAERLAGRQLSDLPPFHLAPTTMAGARVVLARAREPAGGGFHVIVLDRGRVGAVRAAIMATGESLGIQPIGPASYEMLRIEAGLPLFGREMDDRYNPLEVGLEPFISFNKGCYIGQEVVARLDTYDKVQKRLMGLLLPEGALAHSGAKLLAEGKDAGMVTSATITPAGDRPIALAYVRSKHAAPGVHLVLETGGEAEVVGLPFRG